jgi:hypothetical protein
LKEEFGKEIQRLEGLISTVSSNIPAFIAPLKSEIVSALKEETSLMEGYVLKLHGEYEEE